MKYITILIYLLLMLSCQSTMISDMIREAPELAFDNMSVDEIRLNKNYGDRILMDTLEVGKLSVTILDEARKSNKKKDKNQALRLPNLKAKTSVSKAEKASANQQHSGTSRYDHMKVDSVQFYFTNAEGDTSKSMLVTSRQKIMAFDNFRIKNTFVRQQIEMDQEGWTVINGNLDELKKKKNKLTSLVTRKSMQDSDSSLEALQKQLDDIESDIGLIEYYLSNFRYILLEGMSINIPFSGQRQSRWDTVTMYIKCFEYDKTTFDDLVESLDGDPKENTHDLEMRLKSAKSELEEVLGQIIGSFPIVHQAILIELDHYEVLNKRQFKNIETGKLITANGYISVELSYERSQYRVKLAIEMKGFDGKRWGTKVINIPKSEFLSNTDLLKDKYEKALKEIMPACCMDFRSIYNELRETKQAFFDRLGIVMTGTEIYDLCDYVNRINTLDEQLQRVPDECKDGYVEELKELNSEQFRNEMMLIENLHFTCTGVDSKMYFDYVKASEKYNLQVKEWLSEGEAILYGESQNIDDLLSQYEWLFNEGLNLIKHKSKFHFRPGIKKKMIQGDVFELANLITNMITIRNQLQNQKRLDEEALVRFSGKINISIKKILDNGYVGRKEMEQRLKIYSNNRDQDNFMD